MDARLELEWSETGAGVPGSVIAKVPSREGLKQLFAGFTEEKRERGLALVPSVHDTVSPPLSLRDQRARGLMGQECRILEQFRKEPPPFRVPKLYKAAPMDAQEFGLPGRFWTRCGGAAVLKLKSVAYLHLSTRVGSSLNAGYILMEDLSKSTRTMMFTDRLNLEQTQALIDVLGDLHAYGYRHPGKPC